MYLLCHPWVILNIVIVNHRQHHHSRRWCHTAQQHFAIINYVYHPPDHHFLHLHFHHQQDDRSTEHLWPIVNHQGSNPNHQLWSRFINHRQISIFLCVCIACMCILISFSGCSNSSSRGCYICCMSFSGDGVTETKTLMNVKGLSWRLILGLGALPGEPTWSMRYADGWMHNMIVPICCFIQGPCSKVIAVVDGNRFGQATRRP